MQAGGRLDGRVAIITGAARGIGAAAARVFASEGARVVVNDIDAEALDQTTSSLRHDGFACESVAGDCSQRDVAEGVVAAAVQHFDGLDILVNNAGTTSDAAFHAMSDETWDTVESSSFRTALAMCRAVTPVMRDRVLDEIAADGHAAYQRKIINTAAAAYFTGNPGQANLAAAAGAVIGLTRTLARELGSFGVTVNAVAPGFVETRLMRPETIDDPGGVPEPVRQMTKAMTALGRYGTPEDLARVHLFLASEDADFITGVTIPVAGGLLGTSM